MKNFTKKLAGGLIAISMLLAIPVFAASKPSTPKIKAISNVGKNSVTLPISDSSLAGKSIVVKITYTNKHSKKSKTITRVTKLDSSGNGSVKISGLASHTAYTFKIKVKQNSSGAGYSNTSQSVSKTTSS